MKKLCEVHYFESAPKSLARPHPRIRPCAEMKFFGPHENSARLLLAARYVQ